jgi:hypothetical protein
VIAYCQRYPYPNAPMAGYSRPNMIAINGSEAALAAVATSPYPCWRLHRPEFTPCRQPSRRGHPSILR